MTTTTIATQEARRGARFRTWMLAHALVEIVLCAIVATQVLA